MRRHLDEGNLLGMASSSRSLVYYTIDMYVPNFHSISIVIIYPIV